jgi:hypothetical protein
MGNEIIVEVGDRKFVTTKSTLVDGLAEGSAYFKHRFAFESRSSSHENADAEGGASTCATICLDFDPDVFSHVLDYLRSGVMPLLWTEEEGFDVFIYAKIERMADFLQIERLNKWIASEKYLSVVEQKTTMKLLHETQLWDENKPWTSNGRANKKVQYIPVVAERFNWNLRKDFPDVAPDGQKEQLVKVLVIETESNIRKDFLLDGSLASGAQKKGFLGLRTKKSPNGMR